jgi:hypothetical protein
MTSGFQQQQHNYGPILKAAAKPQHIGAKLKTAPVRKPAAVKPNFTAAAAP